MGLAHLSSRTPTFGFIAHPRSEDDILSATCLSLLRTSSTSDADFLARARAIPPTIIAEVLFGFSPFRGEIISIARLPAEVGTARGRQEILRAAQIEVDRGVKVIGLGALTAPATEGGAWLVEQLPPGVAITNGNAYTAAVLRRHVLGSIDALSLRRAARVAIVGCTGSVGSAVSRLLAGSGVELILIGRTVTKVRQILGAEVPEARVSADLSVVSTADIIVTLTNEPSARLRSSLVRPGAIVIDAAEPSNVSEADAHAWRGHATVVRGGRVRIPGYQCTHDFGLEPGETFACLAETYLFAREGIREHSVGAPSVAFAERLERAALRHGVQPSFVVSGAEGVRSTSPLAGAVMR